ncbi:histidine kinase N-terminal 7TM domain-containing protein [Eubacteriaceae bacterium ES2]|nr:histidine kinase N-terminal 7TM domain-containing protein [Eubacteriaceae bacterium ES2]
MNYHLTPYILLLIFSAIITLFFGIYAFTKRHDAKGARSFMFAMIFLTIWSSCNAFEMAAIDFQTKLFWSNMQYFAYCFEPFALLVLAMEFTGHDAWIKNKKIFWLTLVPIITLILVWTNEWHELVRYNLYLDYSGPFPTIAKSYGLYFYVHAFYSEMMAIIGWLLLLRAVFIENTIYRKQAAALLGGLSFIVIPNLIYILGFGLPYDLTPVFFVPAGICGAWGIFKYKLFEVLPVARNKVFDTMDAGIMVLDLQNRVLDLNPAFEKMIAYSASTAITKPVADVFDNIPVIADICANQTIADTEFALNLNDEEKCYELRLSPLTDKKNESIGKIIAIYDITEKKKQQQIYLDQQQALIKQQQQLAVKEELERHARDLHDNLGQVLGFINLQAQGIRRLLKNAEIDFVNTELELLVKETQLAHDEVRAYIRKSRYQENPDFLAALNQELTTIENHWNIKLEKNLEALPENLKLRPDQQANILSIVKEALNNAIRYAGAQNIKISLNRLPKHFCIWITDDGKGFDVEKSYEDHYGLKIMKERAAEIGARITIESDLNKGSQISLCVKEVLK